MRRPASSHCLSTSPSALPSLGRAVFDVVLASNVIEHFDPQTAAAIVENIAALLKPGGRVIVIQPNFRYCISTLLR